MHFQNTAGVCFVLGVHPHQVLLSAVSTFLFSLDFSAPRSLGIIEVLGWWGSPTRGAPRGGSKLLKNSGLGQFAGGTPRERCCGAELSWEQEVPSRINAVPSKPPASLQAAWQVQPEHHEPRKREIRRYQTSDLKRGKSGDFL